MPDTVTPPEPDWKELFQIAVQQRDEATRALQNFQIELHLLRKTYESTKEKLAEFENATKDKKSKT
jgi:hypothetical protein